MSKFLNVYTHDCAICVKTCYHTPCCAETFALNLPSSNLSQGHIPVFKQDETKNGEKGTKSRWKGIKTEEMDQNTQSGRPFQCCYLLGDNCRIWVIKQKRWLKYQVVYQYLSYFAVMSHVNS